MAIEEKITTADVLERLGMQGEKSKLRFWVQAAGIEVPKDHTGAWRWTPALVQQVEIIKTLREVDNRSMDTVRRFIGIKQDFLEESKKLPPLPGEPVAQHEGSAGAAGTDLAPLVAAIEKLIAAGADKPVDGAEIAEAISENLAPQVVLAIREQTELAEKYARAAHQIGKLEAENAALMRQLEERDQKLLVAAVAAGKPWWKFWD